MRIVIEYSRVEPLLPLAELLRRAEVAYLRAIVGQIGRRELAAKALGISRKNLWEKLRHFGLSDLPTQMSPGVVKAAEALKIAPSRMFDRLEGDALLPFMVEA